MFGAWRGLWGFHPPHPSEGYDARRCHVAGLSSSILYRHDRLHLGFGLISASRLARLAKLALFVLFFVVDLNKITAGQHITSRVPAA